MANPSKTAFILVRPTKSKEDVAKVRVGESTIEESENEKVLGVTLSRSLDWKKHFEKVKEKMSKGIFTLKRLQETMGETHLKMLAEGLVMSQARYCSPVYLSGRVRLNNSDTHNQELKKLQMLQNNMLRTVLKIKRRDHIKIEDMLRKVNCLSVNQMACYSILIETWKSIHITGILPSSSTRQDTRTLRSDSLQVLRTTAKCPDSFLQKASKLWEMTSQRFRTTNLLKIAKLEAMTVAKNLPL